MIAIHHRPGSFSDKWIEYCERLNVDYKIVNCYDYDIIDQLSDCDGLLWHWYHLDREAQLFARQLILSVEKMGKKVFPDSNTSWHYDDKIGQKYLLEAIKAPLIKSFVFYDKYQSLKWVYKADYPIVFKTRNGAGSQNVRIIKSKKDAIRTISKAFGKGIPGYNKIEMIKESLWKYKRDKSIKAVGRMLKYMSFFVIPSSLHKDMTYEKNYVYFQEYIPGNNFDIRVVVIGDRAVAFRRFTREDDFRASGSGRYDTNPKSIPLECVKISFDTTNNLNASCIAFDFILDQGNPLIVEISYAFGNKIPQKCKGYWNSGLDWYEEKINLEYFIIEDFLLKLKS